MARLYVLSGDSIGRTFDLDGPVVIGRAEGADVIVPETSISRVHARLEPTDDPRTWRIVDQGSSNGVRVMGTRVEEADLVDGETFQLGAVELRLRLEVDAPAAPTVEPEGFVETEPEPAPEPEGIELEFGEDLDQALREAPAAAPRAARPAPERAAAPSAGARRRAEASKAREARRRAVTGTAERASVSGAADGGRPILQYARAKQSGTSVEQIGGWGRWVIIALSIVLLGSVAYGAFALVVGF